VSFSNDLDIQRNLRLRPASIRVQCFLPLRHYAFGTPHHRCRWWLSADPHPGLRSADLQRTDPPDCRCRRARINFIRADDSDPGIRYQTPVRASCRRLSGLAKRVIRNWTAQMTGVERSAIVNHSGVTSTVARISAGSPTVTARVFHIDAHNGC